MTLDISIENNEGDSGVLAGHGIGSPLPIQLPGNTALRWLRTSTLKGGVPLAVRKRMWIQHDGAPPHFSVDVAVNLSNSCKMQNGTFIVSICCICEVIPHICIKVRRWLKGCIPAVLGYLNESEQIVTSVRSQISALYSTQTVRFRTDVPS